MLGRKIHNYQVEELLGEGGMGTVYKATDTILQRPVALKMLHAHLIRDAVFMERFRNEAVLLARLNHPNVTTLYSFLQDKQERVIVMEWINGVTLERLLRQKGRLHLEPAVRTVIQAIDGLHHAHTKGILHRDMKAANLMLLKEEGSVKLMDFGIAHLAGSQRLTRTDRVVGTLEYMAPELLNGEKPSVQSDLYAVGILLYELLTGRMPFDGAEEGTLLTQILSKRPIPVRKHVPGVPAKIEDLLDRLLQKRPERRFQTALELRSALAAVVTPGLVNLNTGEDERQKKAAETLFYPSPREKKGWVIPWSLPRWKPTMAGIKSHLLSLEGIILTMALGVAILIVSYGFLSSHIPNGVDGTAYSAGTVVVPDRFSKVSDTSATLSATPATGSTGSGEVVVGIPARKMSVQPLREIESASPREPAVVKTKRSKETKYIRASEEERRAPVKQVSSSESLAEVLPAPEKATSMVTIELKGEVLSASLNQTVSSESAQTGQVFWLRTDAPVIVGGVTAIKAGAQVRAIVEKIVRKSDSKRAGLWIRLEAVETAGGGWAPLSFKWSDTAFHPVELRQGFRFKKVRISKTSVTVPR